jgi:hypothetical protein
MATLRSYAPTMSERIPRTLQDALMRAGMDKRKANTVAYKLSDLLAFTPVGAGAEAYDAGAAAARQPTAGGKLRGLAGGAALAAIGAVPGGKGARKGITAYHGSPHTFDRFSLDKIGTGEGVQAYGHGLYFAENEGTAKAYRDTLSGPLKFDGIPSPGAGEGYAYSAIEEVGGDIRKAIADTLDLIKRYPERGYVQGLAVLQNWQRSGVPKVTSPGSMYQVRINADPADFLDWDAPLSGQSGKAQEFLSGDLKRYLGSSYDGQIANFGKQAAGEVLGATRGRGLGGERLSQEAAGQGIPGIKYLDHGSRTAGDGSRNYVVFNDRLIDILKRYGIAGGTAGGATLGSFTRGEDREY